MEYVFGGAVTAVREDADGVHVSFERGAPRRFDLVVGADGLHSNIRGLVLGEESRFLRDLGHRASVFSVPNRLGLDREGVTFPMAGRTVVVDSTRRDASARAMLYFRSPRPGGALGDGGQQGRLLADTFADAGWEVPRLLGDMRDAPDFYFDSLGLVQMDHWSDGRVALVGDAAWCASPASGQGSSMALVGA